MADEPDKPNSMHGPVIQRLVHETGITHEQARDLVALLGLNWSSLIREAKLLKRKIKPRLNLLFSCGRVLAGFSCALRVLRMGSNSRSGATIFLGNARIGFRGTCLVRCFTTKKSAQKAHMPSSGFTAACNTNRGRIEMFRNGKTRRRLGTGNGLLSSWIARGAEAICDMNCGRKGKGSLGAHRPRVQTQGFSRKNLGILSGPHCSLNSHEPVRRHAPRCRRLPP